MRQLTIATRKLKRVLKLSICPFNSSPLPNLEGYQGNKVPSIIRASQWNWRITPEQEVMSRMCGICWLLKYSVHPQPKQMSILHEMLLEKHKNLPASKRKRLSTWSKNLLMKVTGHCGDNLLEDRLSTRYCGFIIPNIIEILKISKCGKGQIQVTSHQSKSFFPFFQRFICEKKHHSHHQFVFRENHGTIKKVYRIFSEIRLTLQNTTAYMIQLSLNNGRTILLIERQIHWAATRNTFL